MKREQDNLVLERNVGRLLAGSLTHVSPEFERGLLEVVSAEVAAERSKAESSPPARRRWLLGAALAASILLAAVVLWPTSTPQAVPQVASTVTPVRGRVSVVNGGPPRIITEGANLKPGQSVRTHSWSEATIELQDRSRLHVRPRSSVQLGDDAHGPSIVLQLGRIGVVAAKQPPGKALTIETPGSRIKVLGTKLSVDLIVRPDGSQRTRVGVDTGRAELESAGRKVLLLPHMEGIADPGQPPIARSLTAEVNEMIRLMEMSRTMAYRANVPAGAPAIVDFCDDASSTVWTVISIENPTDDELSQCELTCALADAEIRAFTLAGARLPHHRKGRSWQLDLSCAPVPAGERTDLIVRVSNVTGLFEAVRRGTFEFKQEPTGTPLLALFQFRLPHSATIEQAGPRLVETRATLSRYVVTVAADSPLPDLFK